METYKKNLILKVIVMEDRPMSMGSKLIGVITEPVKTFQAICESPNILLPAALVLVINLALSIATLPQVKAYTRDLLLNPPNGQPIQPDALSTALTAATVSVILASVLMPPIIWLIQALLLFAYNQFSIGQAKFNQLFAVSFFAWLPVFINSIIKNSLVFFLGMKKTMAIKTSLGLLLPKTVESGFLFGFLNKMDLFTIWGLVLLTIGGAVAMKKDSKMVALYLFALWLIWTAGVALLAATFGPKTGM